MNIAARILSGSNPASPAFVDLEGGTISYAGVSACLDAGIARLINEGVKPKDRGALVTSRGPCGLLGFLTVSSIATCCPIDPRLKRGEVQSALQALSVSAVVDATGEPVFCEIAETLGLKFIHMSFSAADVCQPRTGPFRPAGEQTADVDDIALILQTSGTTSKPKLVPLSHANIL